MRDSEYKKVRAVFENLVRELDLQNTMIIDCLFEQCVLTTEDKDNLNKILTNHDKNRRLLEMLETKEDAAYGHFRDAVGKYQPHLAESLQLPGVPRRTPRSRSSGGRKAFEDFTVTDLREWLQPHLQREEIPENVLEQIADQEINGKVFMNMTDTDLKEVFADLKFGPRKKLALLRDEVAEACLPVPMEEMSSSQKHQKEHARQFGKSPKATEKYYQNRILNVHEACLGSSLVNPTRQFFPCIDDNERSDIYAFIAEKAVIFAAACMNERRNGTIYFGVGNKDCEQYHYGEVLGVPLDKKECEDEIMRSVKSCFDTETVETVRKCIQAVFMEVLPDRTETLSHFVCEVDIQPRISFVRDLTFFLNKAKTSSSREEQILYLLDNGLPAEQSPEQVFKYVERKRKCSEQRQQEDKRTLYSQTRDLPQLLKNFLCGGMDHLDESFCHLLAVAAVDTSQRESLEFIADVDWRGILDFDPKSGERGLYQYMDRDKEMLYKVKMAEDFNSAEPGLGKESEVDEPIHDIDESELKPWIFCNGNDDNDERGHNIIQWKKERCAAFRETIRHFADSIPNGRAVVVILVTSKDEIFIEASEEILLKFQHNWVMMAESEQLASEWIDSLRRRNIEVDLDRCLFSFSFAEINKAIHQLMEKGEVWDNDCFVKSAAGVEEKISKKQVQGLGDLDILSTKTCCVSNQDASESSTKHEHNFYKCNRATWWNFYFPGHVLPRDKLDNLKTRTRTVLDGGIEEYDHVGCVAVYHQPGSGGTTVAMNILWDLHTEFRCCRLKRTTSDTARQILTLYELGESNPQLRRKPVLVMVDNADDDQVIDLKRHVEEECQGREIYSLACVFLICIRCMALPANHQAVNIFLQQKLSIREKQFFVDKYSELKEKGGVNMDHLLGLNIMKEDFNKDYIRRTVVSFVRGYSEHEQTVLRHIALLNCYDLRFRAIPVSCFDQLMMPHKQAGKPWENTFTPGPLMLFTGNNRLSGRNRCLRVSNQLLCSFILDHFAATSVVESCADMMEEFLHSTVFQRRSCDFAIKDLLIIARDCMKKRGMDSTGTKRSRFSPFIQMLVDADKDDDAIQCIHIVFERTEDAFLAQQISRIHIFHKNWDEAEKWAKKAIQMMPQNSFVLDTHGQIFKSRLKEIRENCNRRQGKIDFSTAVKAVEYAFDGCKVFERVQALNDKEANDPPNNSGLFGQMDIVTNLFDVLEYHPAFSSKSDLQKSLSGSGNSADAFFAELDPEKRKWLESLEDKALNCLKEVENQKMMCISSDIGFTDARTKFFLGEDNIHKFEDKLNDRFGLEDCTTREPQKMTTERRQRMMMKLGGNSLYSVMMNCGHGQEGKENAEKIWKLASLNVKGHGGKDPKSKFRNLNMALASALTLTSCHGHEFTDEEYNTILKWSTEMFQMTGKPDTKSYVNIDPYIYLFVFHWPSTKQQHSQGQCKPVDLKKALGFAKEAFTILRDRHRKNNPLFFLTKKLDSCKVISKDRLKMLCDKQDERMTRNLLKAPKAVETVERYNGILVNHGAVVKMKLKFSQGNETEMHIPVFIRESDQSLWNKKVSCVLGVGLGGPVACDVALYVPSQSLCDGERDKSPQPGTRSRMHAKEQKQTRKTQKQ